MSCTPTSDAISHPDYKCKYIPMWYPQSVDRSYTLSAISVDWAYLVFGWLEIKGHYQWKNIPVFAE